MMVPFNSDECKNILEKVFTKNHEFATKTFETIEKQYKGIQFSMSESSTVNQLYTVSGIVIFKWGQSVNDETYNVLIFPICTNKEGKLMIGRLLLLAKEKHNVHGGANGLIPFFKKKKVGFTYPKDMMAVVFNEELKNSSLQNAWEFAKTQHGYYSMKFLYSSMALLQSCFQLATDKNYQKQTNYSKLLHLEESDASGSSDEVVHINNAEITDSESEQESQE